MQRLYNMGISEDTIEMMLELNPGLKELTDNEIMQKEEILMKVKCDESQILNIISSNPLFLSRTNEEIIKLIAYLVDLGFLSLNILFDSNPYILNLEPFEIRNYVDNRLKKGEKLIDIIDDLDSNPYLFNEM